MPSRFLNSQWRFCHVWHNPENGFEFERERQRLLNLSARSNFKWTNQSWTWNDLASGRCRGPHYKSLRKAEEANFKVNFSFFTSLSTGEAHVFGVKFIGLYWTVGFLAIRGFPFWEESDWWSDVWPEMDGVVYPWWKPWSTVGSIIVSVQSNKARALHIKVQLTPKYFFCVNKSLHLFETHWVFLN